MDPTSTVIAVALKQFVILSLKQLFGPERQDEIARNLQRELDHIKRKMDLNSEVLREAMSALLEQKHYMTEAIIQNIEVAVSDCHVSECEGWDSFHREALKLTHLSKVKVIGIRLYDASDPNPSVSPTIIDGACLTSVHKKEDENPRMIQLKETYKACVQERKKMMLIVEIVGETQEEWLELSADIVLGRAIERGELNFSNRQGGRYKFENGSETGEFVVERVKEVDPTEAVSPEDVTKVEEVLVTGKVDNLHVPMNNIRIRLDQALDTSDVRKIYVGGETGMGKSSLCNMILSKNVFEVATADTGTVTIERSGTFALAYDANGNAVEGELFDLPGTNDRMGLDSINIEKLERFLAGEQTMAAIIFKAERSRLPQSFAQMLEKYKKIFNSDLKNRVGFPVLSVAWNEAVVLREDRGVLEEGELKKVMAFWKRNMVRYGLGDGAENVYFIKSRIDNNRESYETESLRELHRLRSWLATQTVEYAGVTVDMLSALNDLNEAHQAGENSAKKVAKILKVKERATDYHYKLLSAMRERRYAKVFKRDNVIYVQYESRHQLKRKICLLKIFPDGDKILQHKLLGAVSSSSLMGTTSAIQRTSKIISILDKNSFVLLKLSDEPVERIFAGRKYVSTFACISLESGWSQEIAKHITERLRLIKESVGRPVAQPRPEVPLPGEVPLEIMPVDVDQAARDLGGPAQQRNFGLS